MGYRKILMLLMMIGLFFISGCDDDDPVSPIVVEKEYLILGEVLMRPYLELMGNIHSIYGQVSDIDSIKIGDSLCSIEKYPYFIEGGNYNYGFGYRNRADSLRYSSGDNIQIEIYRGNETAITNLKLLRVPDDTVTNILPVDSSVFTTTDDFTLTWNKVDNADWYSIWFVFDTSNVFGADNFEMRDYTVDTSYFISSDIHTTDGSYTFFITANSGPVPGEPGNIDSETMTGAIYGIAVPGVRFGHRIYINISAPGAQQQERPDSQQRLNNYKLLSGY